MIKPKQGHESLAKDIQAIVRNCESLRKGQNGGKDVTLSQFVKEKYQMDMESYLHNIGVDPHVHTISNLMSKSDIDGDYRWLVPEVIRQAIRLGQRKAPIWADLIIGETPVSQPSFTLPWWNMSDAAPEYVGEAETIGLGGVSFGQKKMQIRKMGRGIKIPYEVRDYVAVNTVQIFLSDFGVKMNQGLDTLLITMLINGEQADGSESAPVIGVESTSTGFTYSDLVTLWVRMSRIGRTATKMIGGEEAAKKVLNFPEFKVRNVGTPDKTLNLKTPIPVTADFYVHGAVPNDQIIVVDRTAAVMKFNAQPLLVETEKIVSNQTEATYVTETTGFATVYRDGRVIMDESIAFASNSFPSWMDVDSIENVEIKD